APVAGRTGLGRSHRRGLPLVQSRRDRARGPVHHRPRLAEPLPGHHHRTVRLAGREDREVIVHYDDNGPRGGTGSEVTSRRSAVTCKSCRKGMTKRVTYTAQAARLSARRIKERAGACVRCGSVEFLECAHTLSRSYKAIRTDERNAVTL